VYGLLTVGDGLVCQIPSLLIATSAGLVVTRVASAESDGSLGGDVGRQLFGEPRVLTMAATFLTLLAIIPGLPALPFGLCAVSLFAASYGITRARARRKSRAQLYDGEPDSDYSAITLELGPALERKLRAQDVLEHAVRATRERLHRELWLPLPGMALRGTSELSEQAFMLTLHDGTWKRDPEIAALSSDRTNAFVDEWRHARALQVQVHTDKNKAQETVVLAFENPDGSKSELKIDVLTRKPELVLYRPDENLEYHFPDDTTERLLNLNEK